MGCSKSIEDMIFAQMLKSFESGDFEYLEAPDGFEEKVMIRLEAIGAFIPAPRTVMGLRENAIYFVFGGFSIFLGCGLLLALNQDEVLSIISQGLFHEYLIGFLFFLMEQMGNFALHLSEYLGTMMDQTMVFLTGYQYIFPVILGILVAVQYFIYKKDKVEA